MAPVAGNYRATGADARADKAKGADRDACLMHRLLAKLDDR